ncbi:hypothetical protein VZC37_19700 [Gordonia sp. LSe1-13]|uniref:Ig-like domain-containing protein n=1 Tax=Gordonia sesuvii TaxID=3116777 RepID=A0ABU7MHQ2_9ACTN|nr:hypothetical protein [Gordonia sp. LSe1-13]
MTEIVGRRCLRRTSMALAAIACTTASTLAVSAPATADIDEITAAGPSLACEYTLTATVTGLNNTDPVSLEWRESGGAWMELGEFTPNGAMVSTTWTPPGPGDYEVRALQAASSDMAPVVFDAHVIDLGSSEICVPNTGS